MTLLLCTGVFLIKSLPEFDKSYSQSIHGNGYGHIGFW